MSFMNYLSRFYILPIFVLLMGVFLSWLLFKHEYAQENAQFQSEYEFRAQGHTSSFQLGLKNIGDKISGLTTILAHELNAGESNITDTAKRFHAFIQTFLIGNGAIRDIMWYKSSNDLVDTEGFPWVTVLHTKSVWTEHRMNSVPMINKRLHDIAARKTQGLIIMQQPDGHLWLYEIMPVAQPEGSLSWLIVSWDIGEAVKYILAGMPVSGQDILFEFGQAISMILNEASGNGIQANLVDAKYAHTSRSRLNHTFNRNKRFHKDKRSFQWSDDVRILERMWHIRYDSAPSFLITHPVKNAWNVFYGGLAMSALLAFLAFLLSRRTYLIQTLVQLRTRELSQAKYRIQLLLDSIAEGIFDMDMQGHCTFINQRALDMLGFERADQLIGKDLHALIHHSYPA
ncbi:MAG: PAS domain-containing protein [Mariprofundaceae bacterium]|nr:PAS domain-containing protein [Mariprofundaceae bacterium]